jgi:hypothetical protein
VEGTWEHKGGRGTTMGAHRPGRVLVTCLVVLVLQAAHVGCFEAARFTDFPVGSEVNYETTEPIYKATVQADLPIITPPDGFVFPAKVGDEIEFKVAVKRGDGVSAGPRVVNIMFEETPEMLEMVEIGAVRKPIIEVIDRENNKVTTQILSAAVYRSFKFRINAFTPLENTRICFRGIAKNDDTAVAPGELPCTDDPYNPRCPRDPNDPERLSDEFYPKRCVFVDIQVPPEIVHIAPAEAMHDAGPVTQDPAHASFRNGVKNVGELLRLRVHAVDRNAHDDVEIELMPQASSDPRPEMALGPRECCDETFAHCSPHPFGGTACREECAHTCGGDVVPPGAEGYSSSCAETCADQCRPAPCRYVRRELFVMAAPEFAGSAVAGLKFKAKDDGGRYTSTAVLQLCPSCTFSAANQESGETPTTGVSFRTKGAATAFVFPTPADGTTLMTATVNCPMEPLHLWASAPDAPVEIIPAGCSPGSKTLGEECVGCTVCVPELPEGMEVSAPEPFKWRPLDFGGLADWLSDPRALAPTGPLAGEEELPVVNRTGHLGVARVVRWTPQVGQEGQTFALCFRAMAPASPSNETAVALSEAGAERRCFHVTVARCRYCAQGGDSLQSIAKLFRTDWIQLWGANARDGLGPDALEQGQAISLGTVHTVDAPVLFSEIAKQFATSEERLRLVNPGIPREQAWASAGQELCILPGVCDSSVALDGTGLPHSPDPH